VAYAVAADLVLFIHLLFVVFVVCGLALILAGKFLAWQWVRNPWFRLLHLAGIGIVVLQSWLGLICPLTIWENWLRQKAGQAVYEESFVAHFLNELLYYSAPPWVFIVCYTVFGILVLGSWFWVRPHSLKPGAGCRASGIAGRQSAAGPKQHRPRPILLANRVNEYSKQMKHRDEKLAYIKARYLTSATAILEIAPGMNPMIREQDGFNVEYLDAATTSVLRERAIANGRDAKSVPEIHYLHEPGRSMADCVGSKKYDCVLSFHLVEGAPDLVGHFREVQAILSEGGTYAFLVSNKNLCFDARKPESTLGRVVEAHLEKRTTAPVSALIDEYYYGVKRGGQGAWSKRESAVFTPKYTRSKRLMRSVLSDPSIARNWRGHLWQFTPESFADVFGELGQLGLVDLRLIEVVPTDHMDFIAVVGMPASQRR
jgi:uncharacterized protein DUF2784